MDCKDNYNNNNNNNEHRAECTELKDTIGLIFKVEHYLREYQNQAKVLLDDNEEKDIKDYNYQSIQLHNLQRDIKLQRVCVHREPDQYVSLSQLRFNHNYLCDYACKECLKGVMRYQESAIDKSQVNSFIFNNERVYQYVPLPKEFL